MKVIVPDAIYQAMRRHGEETYPHECCGFLLGHSRDGEQRIVDAMRQSNERTDSPQNRFRIAPEEFRAAEKAARATGLTLVGIYHSHPDSPARPSEFDREHAWPWFSYIIVSVTGGAAAEANAWQLRDDRSGYERMALEIENGALRGESG